MALIRANTSGGGGGNSAGKSFDFVASTSGTTTDVGFSPTKVVAYIFISASSFRLVELDVTNNVIWLYMNGQSSRLERTSTFSSNFYVSGNNVYYKALDNDWAKQTYFIAIKE